MEFRIIDCEQGSKEWFDARLGKITASAFDRVITKTGKGSSSVQDVVCRAVAEVVMGEPDETFQSDAMQRGNDLEEDALNFFNFTHGYEFKKCGFLLTDHGYGCSPDGIDLSKKIGLELKCPLAHTHIHYLASGKLPDKYKQQVQGAMLVTGFKQWVFGSYHPSLPCFHQVVERDEKYIAEMHKLLVAACAEVTEKLNLVKLKVGA